MDKLPIDQLLERSVSRGSAREHKASLKSAGFLPESPKPDKALDSLSRLSLKDLLGYYRGKVFVKKRLRKILRQKLLGYENVGFSSRKELWYQASDARLCQELSPEHYYETLRDKFKAIPSRFDELIELDLCRTACAPQDYEDRELHQQKLLKCGNILRTYVKRNPDLGYCQGLNYIVWELIQRFEEVL